MRINGRDYARRHIVGLEAEYSAAAGCDNGGIDAVAEFSSDNEDDSTDSQDSDDDDEYDFGHFIAAPTADDNKEHHENGPTRETAALPAARSRWRALKKHTFELGGMPIRGSILRACSRIGLLQDVVRQAASDAAAAAASVEESSSSDANKADVSSSPSLAMQRRLQRANRINQRPEERQGELSKEESSPHHWRGSLGDEENRHSPQVISGRSFRVGGASRRELESDASLRSLRSMEPAASSGPLQQSFRQRYAKTKLNLHPPINAPFLRCMDL